MADDLPDERPQRRRQYSGAGSTLGVAAAVVLAVGLAIWWFEVRGDSPAITADPGPGILELPAALNPTGSEPAAQPGRAAPNFALKEPGGSVLQLDAYRGSYVLVNFWASWCGPCRGEIPDLQAFHEQAAEARVPLVVLGVNQQETQRTVRDFVAEFGSTYPVVLDPAGEVSAAYRVSRNLPVSFLVSPDGVILKVYPGRLAAEDLAAIKREYLD